MEGLRALVTKEAAEAQISSNPLASSAVQKAVQRYVTGLMQLLLQQHVEESHLLNACEVMRSNEYADIVSERNIVNLCAYPLCQCAIYAPESEAKHTATASSAAAGDDSVLSLHATVRSVEEATVLQRDKCRLTPIPTLYVRATDKDTVV
jgi:predicted RecB family endonuclease